MATNKNLNKAGKIISKICEVFHWVGACISAVSAVICFAAPNSPSGKLFIDALGNGGSIYGLDLEITNVTNIAAGTTYIVFIFLLVLMAMVFRNANLCLKTADGETWFSKGATPFQPDVQRMIREIGIFLIANAVVGLVGGFIISMVAVSSGCSVDASVGMEMVIFGILILCLSQVFSRGIELESEVEGLI